MPEITKEEAIQALKARGVDLENPDTIAKLKKQKEPRAWKAYEPPTPAENSLEAFGRSAKQGEIGRASCRERV